MTGHPRIISYLQRAVSHEFGAAQQFTLQAGLAETWGMGDLARRLREDAREELEHAEAFIQRLVRIGIAPRALQPRLLPVGGSRREVLEYGLATELDAIALYTEACRFCEQIRDADNLALFSRILGDEQQHAQGIRQSLQALGGS